MVCAHRLTENSAEDMCALRHPESQDSAAQAWVTGFSKIFLNICSQMAVCVLLIIPKVAFWRVHYLHILCVRHLSLAEWQVFCFFFFKYNFIYLFFSCAGAQTEGFVQAQQVLCHSSTSPAQSPFTLMSDLDGRHRLTNLWISCHFFPGREILLREVKVKLGELTVLLGGTHTFQFVFKLLCMSLDCGLQPESLLCLVEFFHLCLTVGHFLLALITLSILLQTPSNC